MRECKMKYFEVELENPDEFLKLQTEDFVKANRLLLRKIIQSVTVYEDHFVIAFKSGIEMEIWKTDVTSPWLYSRGVGFILSI